MIASMFGRAMCQASDNANKQLESPAAVPQPGLVKSLVAGRTISAAAIQPGDSCEFGSLHYFALCGLGGK